MKVSWSTPLIASAHDGRQPLHIAHTNDIDVVFATERLDQREMNLQRDVALVLLIRGQHAEGYIVGVPARARMEW